MAPGAAGKREQNARDAARNTGESSEGPAAYDGPNDPPRGRAGSNAGPNRSASRGTATRTASQTRESQMQTARAMQRPTEQQTELLKNVDFGGNAYSTFSQVSPSLACWAGHSRVLFPSTQSHLRLPNTLRAVTRHRLRKLFMKRLKRPWCHASKITHRDSSPFTLHVLHISISQAIHCVDITQFIPSDINPVHSFSIKGKFITGSFSI